MLNCDTIAQIHTKSAFVINKVLALIESVYTHTFRLRFFLRERKREQ